ncbi:MAG: hypothetical protein Q8O55_10125 [Dehalococcoidales bacterium]|nr:hypothetical protein [Dehalococcoidales bacterium]
MKKYGLLGLVITIVVLLGLLAAVPAFAHPWDSSEGAYNNTYVDSPTLGRIAEALGLDTEELITSLQAGETLAEIARNQNVSENALIDAIVTPYAEQLGLQVQYGYLTQERADVLLETARGRATWLLGQDLSTTQEDADWWQEMEDYCNGMMGNYDGSTGYGGMMGNYGGSRGYGGMTGGGMMGGW